MCSQRERDFKKIKKNFFSHSIYSRQVAILSHVNSSTIQNRIASTNKARLQRGLSFEIDIIGHTDTAINRQNNNKHVTKPKRT